VSLDAREQRALNSIAVRLTASAPEFASRLSVFNRLTSGEPMPEDLRSTAQQRHGRHRGGGASPAYGTEGNRGPLMRPSPGKAWPALPVAAALAVTIAVMITLALVLSATSRTSRGKDQASHCAQAWAIPCPGQHQDPAGVTDRLWPAR